MRKYQIRIWGDLALFSRPELKDKKHSYDIITPSAARGVLEAIYWHPGMYWVVEKIYVRKPIQFVNLKRKEIAEHVTSSNLEHKIEQRQRYVTTKRGLDDEEIYALKDVEYIIEAHFELSQQATKNDNPFKFHDIIMRRLMKKRAFRTPCMGCREFPASFELYKGRDITTEYEGEVKDLGFMFYDFDYTQSKRPPVFFRAILRNGVLDVTNAKIWK